MNFLINTERCFIFIWMKNRFRIWIPDWLRKELKIFETEDAQTDIFFEKTLPRVYMHANMMIESASMCGKRIFFLSDEIWAFFNAEHRSFKVDSGNDQLKPEQIKLRIFE